MMERTRRSRIEDLTAIGEELKEEHLRLVAGAARRKGPQSGVSGGTSTSIATYVHDLICEWDADED